MKWLSILAAVLLPPLGLIAFADGAVGRAMAQQRSDIERVNAASQAFIAAIAARDIHAMEKVWAHVPHAVFIGPLSTTVVVASNASMLIRPANQPLSTRESRPRGGAR
jgi:hypothetical protein